MMMFARLNFSGNVSTIDVDNNTSDILNASLLYSNESFSNGTKVSPSSPLISFKVPRLLFATIVPILITFGTYGNAVSFYIMRRGSLKKVSTCFYMAILAIADTFVLWSAALPAWVLHVSWYTVDPSTWLDCKFFYFLSTLSAHLSSCLLAAMCIEKFFALYFPLKTRSICTVDMAKRITFLAVFMLAGINLQNVFIWEAFQLPNGIRICVMVNVPDNYPLIYNRINLTFYSFAPFTIMVLTNGAIIYKFMRASCSRDQGGTESTNQALSKSANRGTAMLITVSLAFLILTGPVAITFVIVYYTDPILGVIIVIMRYTNNSINAVLYCMSGSRFRNEMMKTFPFRLCKKNTSNLRGGSQSASSLTGNSIPSTVTSNASVTAGPV